MSHSSPPSDPASLSPSGVTDELGVLDWLADLPGYDLPPASVSVMRARLHDEYELSHARHADRARQRSLGRFGRLAETALVASVCVVHILWLMQVVLQHR